MTVQGVLISLIINLRTVSIPVMVELSFFYLLGLVVSQLREKELRNLSLKKTLWLIILFWQLFTLASAYFSTMPSKWISKGIRKAIYRRDKGCFVCKKKNNLTLHHLKKRASGGSHSPANLVTVCETHHQD